MILNQVQEKQDINEGAKQVEKQKMNEKCGWLMKQIMSQPINLPVLYHNCR
jgi:hypothetical protein